MGAASSAETGIAKEPVGKLKCRFWNLQPGVTATRGICCMILLEISGLEVEWVMAMMGDEDEKRSIWPYLPEVRTADGTMFSELAGIASFIGMHAPQSKLRVTSPGGHAALPTCVLSRAMSCGPSGSRLVKMHSTQKSSPRIRPTL